VNVLASRAPISPYIPRLEAGLASLLSDLGAGDAFVVTVVPLPNVFSDLHFGIRPYFLLGDLALLCPRVFLPAAYFEELEGALGSAARRDISGKL
jgi:hypothetical protein